MQYPDWYGFSVVSFDQILGFITFYYTSIIAIRMFYDFILPDISNFLIIIDALY
jgi:hypothetical protein